MVVGFGGAVGAGAGTVAVGTAGGAVTVGACTMGALVGVGVVSPDEYSIGTATTAPMTATATTTTIQIGKRRPRAESGTGIDVGRTAPESTTVCGPGGSTAWDAATAAACSALARRSAS